MEILIFKLFLFCLLPAAHSLDFYELKCLFLKFHAGLKHNGGIPHYAKCEDR